MQLVKFYRGEIPNDEGYFINEIIYDWKDAAWEFSHSHIQWCFPTKQPSQFNPDAPLLTDEEITLFQSDHMLILKFAEVFARASIFYGMTMNLLYKTTEWIDGIPDWIKTFNHNFLRMTRILQSLRYLGCADAAEMLFKHIEDQGKSVSPNAHRYWHEATYGELP